MRTINPAASLHPFIELFDYPATFIPAHYAVRILERFNCFVGDKKSFKALLPCWWSNFPNANHPSLLRRVAVFALLLVGLLDLKRSKRYGQ